jgi:hypothetical protein
MQCRESGRMNKRGWCGKTDRKSEGVWNPDSSRQIAVLDDAKRFLVTKERKR